MTDSSAGKLSSARTGAKTPEAPPKSAGSPSARSAPSGWEGSWGLEASPVGMALRSKVGCERRDGAGKEVSADGRDAVGSGLKAGGSVGVIDAAEGDDGEAQAGSKEG